MFDAPGGEGRYSFAMRRTLLIGAALAFAFASAAMAQQYKWTDRNGRVQYGDTPPPGVTATPLRSSGAPASPSAAKPAPSAADLEADFRKRRLEAEKSREKEAQAAAKVQAEKENCARAQSNLHTLESGQRIMRTDAKGERYYLDDAQIAQETVKAREIVRQWCK